MAYDNRLPYSSLRAGILKEVRDFAISVSLALLMLISSKIRVAFLPVPFTMQTFAVVMISLFNCRKITWQSLTIFAFLWRPLLLTSGYVFGFFLVPLLLDKRLLQENKMKLSCRIFLSHLLILVTGSLVLTCFVGMKTALFRGCLFFLPAEGLKGILSMMIAFRFAPRKMRT